MKTLKITIIFILVVLLSTGCWDQRDLSHMMIVSGVAIDKIEDDKILLTLVSSIPKNVNQNFDSGSFEQNSSTFIVSASGVGLMDAYKNIEKKLSREIFFSQLQFIVIGEQVAREGVARVLDFFSRHSEPPMRVYIIATKGKAQDTLRVNSKLEKSVVEQIRKLENLNVSIKMNIKDFLYALTEDGIQPIAPEIEKVNSEKNNKTSRTQTIAMNGTAVFNNDKLVGWLDDKESRGVLWLRNKIKTGVITVFLPKEKGGGIVAGTIIKSNTKIIPLIDNGKLKLKVDVYVETNISESPSKLDLTNPTEVHYVERLYEEDIRKLIERSLEKSQKQFNMDIFGFGVAVNGKYPRQWQSNYKRNWDSTFSNLSVEVSCHVKNYSTGFDTKSLTQKK
ncbi:Ger(x)C family spore germination protein [Clostridium guangxiense]|uniref:Ger(x)C family spore germination protein n=1 Tax=Clostridium guangxiense TaxID=1662055 RepID=UPI001E32D5C9|nr:Ger(x)C family spore germination protein [Clostridium guangxiense]MCD2347688.1 Ger(x)C family spore germination protein [Clostridium guangxiense]